MVKLYAIAIGVVVIVGAGVGLIIFGGQSRQSHFMLETVSPNGTYTLDIDEEVDRTPAFVSDHGEHHARFGLIKEGQRVIEGEPLYSGTSYSEPFEGLYPDYFWLSDSVIRFGEKDLFPPNQHDIIEVANNSHQTLSYFVVQTFRIELFLLFELQSRSALTLPTEPQTDRTADFSEIGCSGRFSDGRLLPKRFAEFQIRGKYKGPSRYSITILDRTVVITSHDFEPLKLK